MFAKKNEGIKNYLVLNLELKIDSERLISIEIIETSHLVDEKMVFLYFFFFLVN